MTSPHLTSQHRTDGGRGDGRDRLRVLEETDSGSPMGSKLPWPTVAFALMAMTGWGVFLLSENPPVRVETEPAPSSGNVVHMEGRARGAVTAGALDEETGVVTSVHVSEINRLLELRKSFAKEAAYRVNDRWRTKLKQNAPEADFATAQKAIDFGNWFIGLLNVYMDDRQMNYFFPASSPDQALLDYQKRASSLVIQFQDLMVIKEIENFDFKALLVPVSSKSEYDAVLGELFEATNDMLDSYISKYDLSEELNDDFYQWSTWNSLNLLVSGKIKTDFKIDLDPPLRVPVQDSNSGH